MAGSMKIPERALNVYANKAERKIELRLLENGHPVYTIQLDQSQAENHARALIAAIELINAAKPKIIIPENVSKAS